MRFLHTAISFCLFLLILYAPVLGAAKLAISPGSPYELGRLEEGRIYNYKLLLRNTGDSEVLVEPPFVSCGCVRVLSPKEKSTLGPGKSLEINFSFNSRGYSGKVINYIYLKTNDPEQPLQKIEIVAEVVPGPKIQISVIRPADCLVCDIESQLELLKKIFLNPEIIFIEANSTQGKKLIEELALEGLPAFVLDKDVEKNAAYLRFKDKLEAKGNYYLVKPSFIGLSYFVSRQRIPAALDLFISPLQKNSLPALEVAQNYNPQVHFLVLQDPQDKTLKAPGGLKEIEEASRAVCVMKYYPQKFFAYLKCRINNPDTSWWEDCAIGLDLEKIRSCAKSKEGEELLRENILLTNELYITSGPVFLLGNQEIFGLAAQINPEDLQKILDKNK